MDRYAGLNGRMGRFFLLGTSHSVTPGPLREHLHSELEGILDLLKRLTERGTLVQEAAVLATCGRLEIYGVSDQPSRVYRLLLRLGARGLGGDFLRSEHLYFATDDAVVDHLFQVSAGLKSAVQGEAQILGQVKGILADGLNEDILGPLLRRLMESGISAGKRVRAETGIGRGAASLAGASLTLLKARTGSLEGRRALVLGAGETGALVAELLAKAGARITVANRTLARARQVAERVGGEGRSLDDLPELLSSAELVVGAVGGQFRLVSRSDVETLIRDGRSAPAWFVDLAHPRNFDPEIGDLERVTVLDLERVERSVQEARDARALEVPRAEAIVAEEAERFRTWLRSRPAVPRLKAVRDQVLSQALAEAERYGRGLDETERERLYRFARSLARTLLHQPTVALREADPGTVDGRRILDAADVLFGLESPLPKQLEELRESA